MSIKTKVNAFRYLLETWVTAMPRILYHSTLALLFDPKGSQVFIHQVLNAQDLESDDPVLGSADIADLLSFSLIYLGRGEIDVQIVGPYYSRRSSDTRLLLELASLAYIMRALKPQLVFEFGTFVGRTTRLLALNSHPDCRIVTIDLPPDHVKHEVGEAFKKTPENDKITQLYGDSRVFDFSPWYGQCDFVWVDASHDYSYVVSDTRNALKLCRPGGWIGWHDYRHTAWWSGVTRTVRQLHRKYHVKHVRGTTIAMLKKPEAYD